MDNLHGRPVFFTADAERALAFYTDRLGFALDWNHRENDRTFVFQVSLLGLQIVVNQTEAGTRDRAGRGRLFVGLETDQSDSFRRHLDDRTIPTTVVRWGAPTIVVHDLDGNELFFWLPPEERDRLEVTGAGRGVEG
jgi:catechol 2,3-dioxygenase-like lactoylglutathione lyase family enzyme